MRGVRPSLPARLLILCLATAGHGTGVENYTYWADPCTAAAERATACEPGDTELARWAFEAWQREAGGRLVFTPADSESGARIRLHWANGQGNLYGETRPVLVNSRRGAEIYVLPDTRLLGRDIDAASRADRLFRDSVVYLTCLHETGHALGLEHTAKFDDIMYTFRYGGDIAAYFGRYRKLLKTRPDIRLFSGVSGADRAALNEILP